MPRRASYSAAVAAPDLVGTPNYDHRLFRELMDLRSSENPARTNDLLVLVSIPCYDDSRGKFASGLPDTKLGG